VKALDRIYCMILIARFALMTTFPNVTLVDDAKSLVDAGLLSAVIFQKHI
jgi:hypothetical protein